MEFSPSHRIPLRHLFTQPQKLSHAFNILAEQRCTLSFTRGIISEDNHKAPSMNILTVLDDVRVTRKCGKLVGEQAWDQGAGHGMPYCELFVVTFRRLLLQRNLGEILGPAIEAFSAEDESVHMCGIRGGTQPDAAVAFNIGEWAGTWRLGNEAICWNFNPRHRERWVSGGLWSTTWISDKMNAHVTWWRSSPSLRRRLPFGKSDSLSS
ncbi:hypothetical protein C8Q74DRAFT_587595 [Fomes fomentarius]|nr:hypothetical protein C8Q74DRAFT_587595 [Fomes fomentarius]